MMLTGLIKCDQMGKDGPDILLFTESKLFCKKV